MIPHLLCSGERLVKFCVYFSPIEPSVARKLICPNGTSMICENGIADTSGVEITCPKKDGSFPPLTLICRPPGEQERIQDL